eukprot:m.45156 g.45156  ORF g.45156 m.45156 type:complete len:194 (+) comp13076_c0_seq1:69-650(+)
MAATPSAVLETPACRNLRRAYMEICDEVIGDVKQHFLNEGVDESVLQQLKALWLENLSRENTLVDDGPLAGAAPEALPEGMELGLRESALGQTDGVDMLAEAQAMLPEGIRIVADARLPQQDGPGSQDDNDDDADDAEDDSDDEDEDTSNVLLCLHEKVGKNRATWRPSLKGGLLTADGKDYAFSSVKGELKW